MSIHPLFLMIMLHLCVESNIFAGSDIVLPHPFDAFAKYLSTP